MTPNARGQGSSGIPIVKFKGSQDPKLPNANKQGDKTLPDICLFTKPAWHIPYQHTDHKWRKVEDFKSKFESELLFANFARGLSRTRRSPRLHTMLRNFVRPFATFRDFALRRCATLSKIIANDRKISIHMTSLFFVPRNLPRPFTTFRDFGPRLWPRLCQTVGSRRGLARTQFGSFYRLRFYRLRLAYMPILSRMLDRRATFGSMTDAPPF
jgi:hypothetical protein